MKYATFYPMCMVLLLLSLAATHAQDSSSKQPEKPQPPLQAQITAVQLQTLKHEVEQLKTTVAAQAQELAHQKGMTEAYAKKSESSGTAWFTALGVVVAALVAGFFAIRNHNKQAAQERLLKAVELIMESRSGYQADIRKQNLSVFLDEATKNHLTDIKTTFSGPEYTDLHIALAQAMSVKATTAGEVFEIWKAVLKEKNVYGKIQYVKKDEQANGDMSSGPP